MSRFSQRQFYSDIKDLARKMKQEGIPVLDENGNEINRIKL